MRRSRALAMLAAAALGTSRAEARRRQRPTPSPSPSPTPSATPPSAAVRFAALRRDLASLAATAPGRLGIAVVDLLQYSRFTANADEPFALGGLAHLAIALVAYRRADQRRLDLDARLDVAAADLRHGPSPIAALHPHGGASYTVVELLRATLVDGDPTASDRILREIGGPPAVDAFLERAGLAGFDLRKSAADVYADALARRAFARGADNSATPDALANFLTGVAMGHYLRFDTTNELLATLGQARAGANRIAAGFPPRALFAHITATTARLAGHTDTTADAGILTLPDGRRVVIVAMLGDSTAETAAREATLARVGRAVYEAYVP